MEPYGLQFNFFLHISYRSPMNFLILSLIRYDLQCMAYSKTCVTTILQSKRTKNENTCMYTYI